MRIWDTYAQVGAREIHAHLGRASVLQACVGKEGLNKKSNFSLVKNSAYRTMG
jgi:hypothetical protein